MNKVCTCPQVVRRNAKIINTSAQLREEGLTRGTLIFFCPTFLQQFQHMGVLIRVDENALCSYTKDGKRIIFA